MDSNLAQPCEEPISSEDSRDSNVGPNNLDVDASHDINCKDENSDAPEMNATENGNLRTEFWNGNLTIVMKQGLTMETGL